MAFNVSYIFQARDQFSSVAKKVQRSMGAVRKQMSGVARQIDNVGRKFVTTFKTKATAALAATKRKLDSLSRSSKKLSKNLRATAAGFVAFTTLPVAFLVRSFVNAASNAEETRSKFNTVFSDIRSQADMTANNLGKNFGLSGTKARELIGDTGDLLTGFGFASETALDLSNKVNELAVDLASFTNFSGGAEGASKALTKALLGERESIKSLGISILEEDVKARVKQLVLVDKMKFATLRQAKAFATLQLAQEQSKNAIGDFNRTSESYANKVRIMQARTQDLRESFGNILLPIATKVVEALTSLSEKFTDLSPAVKKIILITASLVAVIGPLLLVIAGIAAVIPFLIIGFTGIGIAIAFMLSPIGLVIAAVAALAIVIFSNFNAIQSFIADTIDFIIDKFKSLVNIFSGIFTPVVNFLESILDGVVSKIDAVIGTVRNVARFIGSIFDTAAVDIGAKRVAAENVFNSQNGAALKSVAANEELTTSQTASARIDVNMNAPEGVIKSVRTQRKGDRKAMDLGVNMRAAG